MLARAFDLTWKRYYRPSRKPAIPEDIARPALAKCLVALMREGVVSIDDLAEGGLRHLIELTPVDSRGHLTTKGEAKFQRMWRVRHNIRLSRS
jgi:hypothetical protein